jgi:hypothetical protein
MERYNHALLLPAMAWLWGRGCGSRNAVVAAYALSGLSRFTHLFAFVLPSPWAPLATGVGLYSVLLVGASVARALWRQHAG